MKIGIIGSGAWGCALGQVLADNNHDVLIYGNDESQINSLKESHTNPRYFDDHQFPESINATLEMHDLLDRDVLLIAVPTVVMEKVLLSLNEILNKQYIFINVAKGFFPGTNERMSQVIERCIDEKYRKGVVSLLGPSFASEVANYDLTTVNAVSKDEEIAKIVQNLFSNHYFRVYTSNDLIGSETASSLKNVMALATGMADGLGLGSNAKAGLITRGLAEITRFGVALGADHKTFLGLTGVGDLILTCTSTQSRNYSAGKQIGQDNGVEKFYQENKMTVEGINTAKVIYEYAKELNVEMPITDLVYRILFENEKPSDGMKQLMERKLKAE